MYTAQFAAEPAVVVHSLLNGHNPSTQCPRHALHQMNCADRNCEQCIGRSTDLEDVDSTYVPIILGRGVAQQLPLLKTIEAEIRRDGRGNIRPTDVDWERLNQRPSK